MRKLSSKKEEAKKRKRNQIIIGVILVVVMFGSVFGLATLNFDNPDESNANINYEGYEFINQGSYWYLTIGGEEYGFQYNPYQIQESFNLTTENLRYLNAYSNAPLYINSFSNVNAEVELVRVFNRVALRIQKACLSDNSTETGTSEDCLQDLPIKDCSSNFIIVREGEQERIYQEENCVFIEGSIENLIKLTDDYLYRIMGIKSQI